MPALQVPRSTTWAPEHVLLPHALVGYWQRPSLRPAQVPWQVGSLPQDWVQQEPCVQTAVPMQAVPELWQAWPSLILQAPAPSQVLVLGEQRPVGSSWFFTDTHVWLDEQVWQLPAQSAFVQQEPAPVGIHVVVPPLVQDCVLAGQA